MPCWTTRRSARWRGWRSGTSRRQPTPTADWSAREAWVVGDTHWLGQTLLKRWPGLATGSLMLVRRTRQDLTDLTGQVAVEEHHYMSSYMIRSYMSSYMSSLGSADDATAARLAGLARGHWAVENNLHWQLDVSFDEDRRRVRKGHGAQNVSRLCRIARP